MSKRKIGLKAKEQERSAWVLYTTCELCDGRGEIARFEPCPYEGVYLYFTADALDPTCAVCGVPQGNTQHELVQVTPSPCSWCSGTGEVKSAGQL